MPAKPGSPHVKIKFKPTGSTKGDRAAIHAAGAAKLGIDKPNVSERVISGMSTAKKNSVKIGILSVDAAKGTALVFKRDLPVRGKGPKRTLVQNKAKKAKTGASGRR